MEIPESFSSLEALQQHLDRVMNEQNNRSIPEFEGYSPAEMHLLLHQPFNADSPLQMKPLVAADCNKVPIYQLVFFLMKKMEQEGAVGLTKTGALPIKWVAELYAQGFIKEEFIESGMVKLYKEADSQSIQLAHFLLYIGKLAKKRAGKLSLTKTGQKLLANPLGLLENLFNSFTQKFNWGYFDGYGPTQTGRFAWGFTLVLLLKHGQKERDARFYAKKYLEAFPMLTEEIEVGYGSPEDYLIRCYVNRAVRMFLPYFGLATIQTNGKIIDYLIMVEKTDLLDRWFEVREHRVQ
jgi:hypothetical protein